MTHIADLTLLNSKDPDNDVRRVTKALVPGWESLDNSAIQVERLEMGITNKLFLAKSKGQTHPKALVRVYGAKTEQLIDRGRELKLLDELTQLKAGASLYGTFSDGYCYEYLEGRPLTHLEMAESTFLTAVAKKMAWWHKLPIKSVPDKAELWTLMRGWISNAPRELKTDAWNAALKRMGVDRMAKEVESLTNLLAPLNSPVVFSHNDLLCANLIYNKEDNSVSFIDVEYACYNPRGFDIGNHFDEYIGFDLEFNLYPSVEKQREFCRAYLGDGASEEDVAKLAHEGDCYSLAAHLLWSIWALYQARNSDLDFDFMDYGEKRFNEYLRRKKLLFPSA